jgi:hypothetical protein
MKRYEGIREPRRTVVTVNGRVLDARLDLADHSPDGFEWGYSGSGPAQLALALLADALGNDATAIRWYQDYKRSVVSCLPALGWTLTDEDIRRAIQSLATA